MLIIANWKAYVENVGEADRLVALAKRLSVKHRQDIVLAPAMPQLGLLAHKNRSKVRFAAQDISVSLAGAHTGEVTAASAAQVGASYVILGHSERRAAGETDAVVVEKVQHALRAGLIPVLCVGERERDQSAAYLAEIRNQISAVMAPLTAKERAQVVIAYEPVWAIGKSALEAIQPADLAEMVLYIRKVLGDYLPGKAPGKSRILYGGSVEPGNAPSLAKDSRIDGFLVGHASVEQVSFAALVKAVS